MRWMMFVFAIGLSGCALQQQSYEVTGDYAKKRGCARDEVSLIRLPGGNYRVNGCGRDEPVDYKCERLGSDVQCYTPDIQPRMCFADTIGPTLMSSPPETRRQLERICKLDYCDTPKARTCGYVAAYASIRMPEYARAQPWEMIKTYSDWAKDTIGITARIWNGAISNQLPWQSILTIGSSFMREQNAAERDKWLAGLDSAVRDHPNQQEREKLIDMLVYAKELDKMAWDPDGSLRSYTDKANDLELELSKSMTRFEMSRETKPAPTP